MLSAIRPWFTRLTARRNSLSAREGDEVFERRSILPGAAADSPTGIGGAEAVFAAATDVFAPDREDDVLELRRGMGVVNSVASRSMSTFTFSERCGKGAFAAAGAGGGAALCEVAGSKRHD